MYPSAAYRRAWTCTLVTSGHVASIVFSPRALSVRVDRRRDSVRREDDRLALGHLALVLDEDRAARLEVTHDVRVVDDLLAHVDGRPVQVEELLDRVDGALDARAIAARRR